MPLLQLQAMTVTSFMLSEDPNHASLQVTECTGISNNWSIAVSPIAIQDFPLGDESIQLDPPLMLPILQNPQDSTWEACGEDLYASVFVSAPDVASAIDELRTDVLPFLWRQYALEDDASLSQRARELKADLLRRVRA